jgi:hypothetical protein
VHGLQLQRLQNEHIQSALHEITGLIWHKSTPLAGQEEVCTSPIDCQGEEQRTLWTVVVSD